MGSGKLTSVLVLLLAIYIASPFIFRYSTFIQRNLLFMNYVNTQFGQNLSQPETYGLKCTRTLQLENNQDYTKQKILIGAWHIVPENSLSNCVTHTETNRTSIDGNIAFADDRPIILYVHGNGGTRGGDHRSRLYRKLAYEFNFHVITFDYRGYADSTYLEPTVDGVTADARFVFKWLLKQKGVSLDRISVWGHSLGTAIATRMLSTLKDHERPKRLVLEAPFDDVAGAIRDHPFSAPFRIIPYFEHFFIDPMRNSRDFNFDSVRSISKLKATKVLIMHAEDDAILPINLGKSLYNKAKSSLGDSIGLITIGAEHKLGHKHICMHDDTMSKVRVFIETDKLK